MPHQVLYNLCNRLLELALHKYKISAKEEIQDCLRRIHVWRPESLKDIIEKYLFLNSL